MSRQNRATPPQIKVSHLSPNPPPHRTFSKPPPPIALSCFIRSRQGAKGGVSRRAGAYRGTFRFRKGVLQLQSHQSRYSVNFIVKSARKIPFPTGNFWRKTVKRKVYIPENKERYQLGCPLRLRISIAVEDAVDNRGLYRVFVFCVFLKAFWRLQHHYPKRFKTRWLRTPTCVGVRGKARHGFPVAPYRRGGPTAVRG